MQYRKHGNTGIHISALGFGCMRLPEYQDENGNWCVEQEKVNEMLLRAYDLGINYFDTAPYYCHHGSEAAIGKALAPIRDKVYISTKCDLSKVTSADDYEASLDRSLERMGLDYIDFFHFWGINREEFDNIIVPLGLLDRAKELKKKGKIRHISFSFHDKPEALQYIIDNGEGLETVLLQYNLLDRANEEMIDYAAKKGLGIVVMGPVGGGRLAAPTELSQKLGSGNLHTYELALRFVLGNKNVCCALSGMQTVEMVEQNCAIGALPEPMREEQWKQVGDSLENLKKFSELYCTGCAYCQPCPKNINIPKIFQAYTYHNVYGLSELAKKTYLGYVNNEKEPGATAADCIGCGRCEESCPQHLQIRQLLQMVDEKLTAL